MVHRAILGSLERFFGVLVEHHAGAFPVWLAPVQVRLVPVADRFQPYAQQVSGRLRALGIRTEVDVRNEKIGYKIRDAEVQKIPYILVVGEKETTSSAVSVRKRGGRDLGVMPFDQFEAAIQEELKPAVKVAIPASHEGGNIHQ